MQRQLAPNNGKITPIARNSLRMLTEIYIEALLVDEELADQVWEAWDAGEIDDLTAWLAWAALASIGNA